ncbi:type III secretion protein [Pseudomonas sp. SZMC_28357]|uniref:type III secretion protein n=1 Tax=Pseudomonas sp. SZMC_28357 TaxID=3074380 RepID=UPI0028725A99|nr:type III secretion protein [Pseudomonas sp. SZMC_28357]MDR9750843.1 type III secretion protein [Pseudomonas sp. SZMC_28357]
MSERYAEWQQLTAQPLDFVSGDSLRACFASSIPVEQIHGLITRPRFSERLLHLLMTRRQLSPLVSVPLPEEHDLAVLLLSAEAFAQLPRLCGAVWHGVTLSREIRSEVLNPLRAALGAEVYAQALAHRHLAGAANLLLDPPALIAAIERDGLACVNAWFREQPPALQAWLRLRLPDLGEDGARLAKGAQIVREMAITLTSTHKAQPHE